MITPRFPHRRIFLVLTALLATSGAWSQTHPISVPLVPQTFTLSQRNFKIPEAEPPQHNHEQMEFLGRQSYHLAHGLAFTSLGEFQNGTMEVDVAADSKSRFFGIAFHVQSDDDYEVIFFRPRGSDTDQAVQYTPGLHGANAWQIYTGPGYTATAHLPRNEWMHLRLVVSGVVAKLYLNNAPEPTLVIPDLKLGQIKGGVGFWGHMGGGYYSNLTVTPDNTVYDSKVEPHFEPGTLTSWELSDAFDAVKTRPDVYPAIARLKWEKVAAENPGMVVINRYRRSPNIDTLEHADRVRGVLTGSQVVFAKTTIHAERAEIRKLNLGYSDDVVAFLNGKPIYSGNNELGFRQGNFLGLLDANNDAVYLPLNKGDNELLLGVTEFFGGWGFMCKWAE